MQASQDVLEMLLKQDTGNLDIRNKKEETPLHLVIQKLSSSQTNLEMIGARNRISRANLLLQPRTKVAAKIKHSDPLNIQIDIRLKAIGENLIFSGADLTAIEQSSWSYVHMASKSFNLDTLRWMLSINKVLR